MADSTITGHTRVVPAIVRTTRPVALKIQQEIKSAVHQGLIKRLDLEKIAQMHENPSSQQQLQSVIHQLIGEQNIPLSAAERDRLAQEVLDEVFGLGPLEPLLQDASVNDILVNTCSSVYVERRGVLEKTTVAFKDDRHLMHVIDKIVSAVGRRVDESSPMVDARLKDGSRVNVIIPPLAVDGPILSIRKFGSKPLSAEDLLRNKALTEPMLEVLKGAVQARLNIIVSGGTGSGKTTLLNVMSSFVDERERIVTIEDSAELQVKHAHVVRLECRPPNVEGKGAVRQRELVINALRMRPDRIILGEVRGGEALDMLQAMNTGHEGSMTTIHANTPRDAIARLETLSLMAELNLPDKAIRQQIASAITIIVQVARLSDGVRRITNISEVIGYSEERVTMQDILVFEKLGIGPDGRVLGRFRSTGLRPTFAERLKVSGIHLPNNMFDHVCEV